MAPKTRTGIQSPACGATSATAETRITLTLPQFARWGNLSSAGGEWTVIDVSVHTTDLKFLDHPDDTASRLLTLHLMAADLVTDTSRTLLADGNPNWIVASYPVTLAHLNDNDLTHTA